MKLLNEDKKMFKTYQPSDAIQYGDKKIIRKTNVRGALIKDEELLKEDLYDGWTVTDEMEEILDNMEKVVYELRHTFRGYYTQVTTYNELADYFDYNMVNSMEEMASILREVESSSGNEERI